MNKTIVINSFLFTVAVRKSIIVICRLWDMMERTNSISLYYKPSQASIWRLEDYQWVWIKYICCSTCQTKTSNYWLSFLWTTNKNLRSHDIIQKRNDSGHGRKEKQQNQLGTFRHTVPLTVYIMLILLSILTHLWLKKYKYRAVNHSGYLYIDTSDSLCVSEV
jgi:hypothetical protein